MKFYVDTADVEEIRELSETGLLDGVTTNPSLIAKSNRNVFEVLAEICDLVDGPVSGEVTATDRDGMVTEGRRLHEVSENVMVKVPLTWEGLKACRILNQAGIQVNVTLCFSANQAVLAAKAGATVVSPFVGRLDDIGQDGMALIHDIRLVFDNYQELSTEILVASIRHPMHVLEAAKIGADICTVPPQVLRALATHPLTDTGLEAFLEDWKKTGQNILGET
tara:strand:+ start:1424 stop:2089 length:666 start_codon:yes stop_codon:yes gene_type:complete